MRQSESVFSDVGLPGVCNNQLLTGEWTTCTVQGLSSCSSGALRQLLTAPHWQILLAVWLQQPAWVQPFIMPGEVRIAGSGCSAGLLV